MTAVGAVTRRCLIIRGVDGGVCIGNGFKLVGSGGGRGFAWIIRLRLCRPMEL